MAPIRYLWNCSRYILNSKIKVHLFGWSYCYFWLSDVVEITLFELAMVDSSRIAVGKQHICRFFLLKLLELFCPKHNDSTNLCKKKRNMRVNQHASQKQCRIHTLYFFAEWLTSLASMGKVAGGIESLSHISLSYVKSIFRFTLSAVGLYDTKLNSFVFKHNVSYCKSYVQHRDYCFAKEHNSLTQ